MSVARVTAIACASITMSMLVVGTAGADPQIGSCTSSYKIYIQSDLQLRDPAVTVDLFNLIDTNHDRLICFKPYPNGDHNGHGGNLVDDKSGPKSS